MSAPEQFDVSHVAELARITLTDEEKTLFQKQLGDVLKYIDKLKDVDIRGVTLVGEESGPSNIFREDIPQSWFTADEALANAPRKANGLFIVPKVIE